MSLPRRMHTVEDGYVEGNVERNRQRCGVCDHPTLCIRIHSLDLPPGDPTTIFHKAGLHIGIGCGCYAKAHRQLAHIGHNKSRKGPIRWPT